MPIISKIGRRNWGVRVAIAAIYTLLGLGAVTMIYPLLLMLSGSVKSDTDYQKITPLPEYLWNDDLLWMKYVEARYGVVPDAEKAWHGKIDLWRKITPPPADQQLVGAYQRFRAAGDWKPYWFNIGQLQSASVLGANTRRFRQLAKERYPDITGYSEAVGVRYTSWSQAAPPATPYAARRFNSPAAANYQLLDAVKRQAPLADRIPVNLDGIYWYEFLRPQWATIEQYNAAHGTKYLRYDQVLLAATAPPPGQARADWEQFVRQDLNLAFIRFSSEAGRPLSQFLAHKYDRDISQLNSAWNTHFSGFDEIPLPNGSPASTGQNVDLAAFLKDANACPTALLSVYGPRQAFEAFVAAERGSAVGTLPLPLAAADYADFQQLKVSTRWELFTRNYIHVFDYLLMNGNGLRNTIIYCLLTIAVTLMVNPLAAYALSRYRPPSTYKVLLFCMCTMAFPGEVTMIPSFLLLKRFPLVSLAVAVLAGITAVLLLAHYRWPDWIKGTLAGGVGLLAGFWLLPRLFGDGATHVSLLNTFWALALPSAANGFGIFLLKGFFDSLPQELYEAAEIDGAGEFTKFWTITMSLSKPILAVMALGAFTAAYSEFMMALVIIPDPDMWTIMVWLFQLQSQVHPTVVYASLVIAAIPTFAVFLFCQNLIMRGIVVPVEK
jgi:multiple sugar transport system permease protein